MKTVCTRITIIPYHPLPNPSTSPTTCSPSPACGSRRSPTISQINKLWRFMNIGAFAYLSPEESMPTSVYELLPATPSFVHYRGSLTTPPCTEVRLLWGVDRRLRRHSKQSWWMTCVQRVSLAGLRFGKEIAGRAVV